LKNNSESSQDIFVLPCSIDSTAKRLKRDIQHEGLSELPNNDKNGKGAWKEYDLGNSLCKIVMDCRLSNKLTMAYYA
jgi:hypothetical protein